jgi:hypothetical protein
MIATFILLHIVHALAALAIVTGFLFLVIWAVKNLSPARLKSWGMWLFFGGLVLCILATAAGGKFGAGTKYMNMGSGMMKNSMMLDRGGMMGMSMDDMSKMLEGKTGDEFDQAFLEGMIPHHQGAIDMAEAALESAGHQEIKDMATAIIEAQQQEIDEMRAWQKAWGF